MNWIFTQSARKGRLVPASLFTKLLAPLMMGLLMNFQVAAQSNTNLVSGKITDENGEGLPGVAVMVKGTSIGTVTDIEGKYSLNAASDQTLVFSFVGYLKEEIAVQNQSNISVSLVQDVKSLEEVVVIGYGTQRQEAITGSVASIKGEVMREVPAGNITQALQGRLPGVELTPTSSQPGASMQIRIRGTRSLTASNDPLVVLDGIPFPGNIGDINPNDIKSVDILKDASATAIYGSRGANGVILVTTNSGIKGQKPQITYNGFHGLKNVFAPYPMMNNQEYAALRQYANLYENGIDESNDVNTDWQDLTYQTGIITSHDFGISGATDQGRYNFNAGYFKDEGIVPTQQYSRFTLRGAIDQGIGKHIRVGLTTFNNYNITQGSQVGMHGILSKTPLANPFNEDGSWKRTVRTSGDESWVYSRDVLNNIGDQWLDETRAFATYNSMYGEVQIPGVEGLKLRTNIGLNYRQSNNGAFTGRGINNINLTSPSTASVGNQVITDWTIENLITYDKVFAEKHILNVVGLYSASERQENHSHMFARNIPSANFQFYNLGHATDEFVINPENQLYRRSGLLSYMGRVMYSYDDRYMLTATLRTDASSRLAPGHQWHTYPAVSAGWNIKREAFMQNVDIINMLKLRVGYGITSNQSVLPYKTLGLLDTRPYNFGPDGFATGYFVTELNNYNLGWEFSETLNFGLDFALINHRLTGSIEHYITNTKDLLLAVGLPQTSGVEQYTANVGETQNRGIELSLNGVILDNYNGWTWEAGVNLYANRNKLVALNSGRDRDESNWWFVGHPINVVYDYERIGLWQEGDPHMDILQPGANVVGSIKVKYTGDYNEAGEPVRPISGDDRQIMSLDPNFMGGLNTRVGYKGFDLTIVGAFKSGGVLISSLYGSSGYLNQLNGRVGNVKVDYWTPENTDAWYPNPRGQRSGDNPNYASTLSYFDASYLKIRTMTLGYNFQNSNWVKKVGVRNLRVYTSVQNPFVMFSPYHRESGMDPETSSYGNENAAVPLQDELSRLLIHGITSPATRNYLIGLNITF